VVSKRLTRKMTMLVTRRCCSRRLRPASAVGWAWKTTWRSWEALCASSSEAMAVGVFTVVGV
jgi:hypothetical protein